MGGHSCCYKQKLRKGLWSPEEDEKLIKHITEFGHGCWSSVPKQAVSGLQRCGKSCRLRWINYLRPDLKRGTFSQQEEDLIIELHAVLGNRYHPLVFSLSQAFGFSDTYLPVPGRIKNFWNSCIKKMLKQRGIDPNTHKPLAEVDGGGDDKAPDNSEKNSGSGGLHLPVTPALAIANQRPTVDKSMDESTTSKSSATPTKEIFLDQFLANHESSSTCRSPNPMGSFPLPLLSFAPDYSSSLATSAALPFSSNPLLWLNQTPRQHDATPELSCNAISAAVSSLSTSAIAPPSCAGDSTISNWYAANCNNSPRSSVNDSGGFMLQSSCSFDSGIFPWSELTPDKDVQVQLGGETEDLKWSEYLHGAFPASAAVQAHQSSQPLYGDIKGGSQFTISGLSIWQQNQQLQHQLQAPDISGKDFQSVSVGFQQI
ncbi:hypothetical protein GW17_00057808 [Ensete ventricosum]|nr:hypothetical protein GW17_00057808 [Ensete ventricosum]